MLAVARQVSLHRRVCTADPLDDLVRPSKLGPDPANHSGSVLPQSVLSELLPVHRVTRGLALSEQPAVLDLAIELAQQAAAKPAVIGTAQHAMVDVEDLELQRRLR